MPVVVTNIKRADRAAADALAQYGVATVHEAQGRTGLMHQRLRPIWRGPAISGTAVTCTLPPGDNWMIHVAVEQCQPGDILVAATISEAHSGYFGDLLGTILKARGVRGLILDAGCRDIDDLEKMGFPVWSRSHQRAWHRQGNARRRERARVLRRRTRHPRRRDRRRQ